MKTLDEMIAGGADKIARDLAAGLNTAVDQIGDMGAEIARLRAELEQARRERDEAREALRPFAHEADEWHHSVKDGFYPYIADHDPSGTILPATFTVGDLRRARELLATPEAPAQGKGGGA